MSADDLCAAGGPALPVVVIAGQLIYIDIIGKGILESSALVGRWKETAFPATALDMRLRMKEYTVCELADLLIDSIEPSKGGTTSKPCCDGCSRLSVMFPRATATFLKSHVTTIAVGYV